MLKISFVEVFEVDINILVMFFKGIVYVCGLGIEFMVKCFYN